MKTPNILALLLFSAALSSAAPAPPNPAEGFSTRVLAASVNTGLQPSDVAAMPAKLEEAKAADPGLDWTSSESAVTSIRELSSQFEALKARSAGGAAASADEIELLRAQLRDLFGRVGIEDKNGALETTYVAQLAPLPAVRPEVAADVNKRLSALEKSSAKLRDDEQFQAIKAAASNGDWQAASRQFGQLYDRMKTSRGSEAGELNVIARAIKPRPADGAVRFTRMKSQYESGLKINNKVPAPYPPEAAAKHETAAGGKKFGTGVGLTGGGILLWAGAAALGVVSAPPAAVVVIGVFLIVGGYGTYKIFRSVQKGIEESAEKDSDQEY